MAELNFWDEPDGPWDRLQLGNFHMPGAWTVTCECSRDIDVKKSKGKDGAHVQDHGYRPATIHLKGTIWEREQWKLLQTILPELHPRKKGGDRAPLNAEHPALAIMGVHTIYVHKIHAPEIGDKGLELDIECLEWTPPKGVKKKPAGPINWSDAQKQANAHAGAVMRDMRLETEPVSGVGRIGGEQYTGYRYSPAEIAAAEATRIEDAKKTKEITDLMPPARKPSWYHW